MKDDIKNKKKQTGQQEPEKQTTLPSDKIVEETLAETPKEGTDAGAEAIAQESKDTTSETKKQGEEAAKDAANPTTETPGVNAPQPSQGNKGKPQSVEVHSLNGGIRFQDPIVTDQDYTFNDQDRIERDTRLATAKVNQISSKILREATARTQRGDESITGDARDDSIYQEETDITLKTMVGAGRYYDNAHPQYRPNGAGYIGINTISPVSGDYVLGLHDSKKGFDSGEVLKFNKLDQYGIPVVNQFVVPKRGQFWLRGIRPYLPAAQALTKVATTKSRDRNNDEIADIGLYQYVKGESDLPMFDVVDVSIYLQEQHAAINEVLEKATCIDTKYQFGLAERIGDQVRQMNLGISDPGEIVSYPDFGFGAQRSSLTDGIASTKAGETKACYNSMDKYALFMQYLADSELVSNYFAMNLHNIKENLKYFKANEGRRGMDTVYYEALKQFDASDRNTPELLSPTLANYGSSMASNRKFNNMPKWIYTFSEFWRRIEVITSNFLDHESNSELGDVINAIKVAKHSLDTIQKTLAIGRFTSSEGANSTDLVAVSGTVDVVINFDPNDLIQVFAGSPNKVVPAAGYQNVWARENPEFGRTQNYFILPLWMQTFVHAADDERFIETIADDGGALKAWFTKTLAAETADNYYLPFKVDTLVPTWLSIFYFEATSYFERRMHIDMVNASAYMRWFNFLKTKGIDPMPQGISVKEYLNTLINNEALWLKSSYRTPADYPMLFDEARDVYEEGLANGLFGIAQDWNSSDRQIAIFRPTLEDAWVEKPAGWNFRSGSTSATTTWATKQDMITALIADSDNNYSAQHGEIYFTRKYYAIRGNDGVDEPLNEIGRSFKLPQFGADASDFGYQSDPIESIFTKDGFDIVKPVDCYLPFLYVGQKPTNLLENVPKDSLHVEMAGMMIIDGDSYLLSNDVARLRVAIIDGDTTIATKLYLYGNEMVGTAITIEDGLDNSKVRGPKLRQMCKPSLYGYSRVLPAGVGNVVYEEAEIESSTYPLANWSRTMEDNFFATAYDQNDAPHADTLSLRTWTFVPDIIEGTDVSDSIDVAQISQQFYYDRQNCAVDMEHESNLSAMIAALGINIFRSQLIYGGDLGAGDEVWDPDFANTLGQYHFSTTMNTITVIRLFALLSSDLVQRLQDDRLRYFGSGPTVLNESLLTIPDAALGTTDVVLYGGIHDHLGPDYMSQFMFNDVGNYIIGRPLKFLNKSWTVYGNINKAFVQKYLK